MIYLGHLDLFSAISCATFRMIGCEANRPQEASCFFLLETDVPSKSTDFENATGYDTSLHLGWGRKSPGMAVLALGHLPEQTSLSV